MGYFPSGYTSSKLALGLLTFIFLLLTIKRLRHEDLHFARGAGAVIAGIDLDGFIFPFDLDLSAVHVELFVFEAKGDRIAILRFEVACIVAKAAEAFHNAFNAVIITFEDGRIVVDCGFAVGAGLGFAGEKGNENDREGQQRKGVSQFHFCDYCKGDRSVEVGNVRS